VRKRILMLDSGLGGLTVYREVIAVHPDADYVYVADDATFPYGGFDEQALVNHVVELMNELIDEHQPDLVIIPCNTASTIVLPALRGRFAMRFIGTVPAIKPACAASITGRVSVLGTNATVEREYTHALIRDYAGDCDVRLVGSKQLAAYAEAELAGAPVSDTAIHDEIAPCFVNDGKATDTIVLACTHYPVLIDRFRALSPWPVLFFDPAPAIARRVVALLGPPLDLHGKGTTRAVFTSGIVPAEILARFGIGSDDRRMN
jgi:glutamate racemase